MNKKNKATDKMRCKCKTHLPTCPMMQPVGPNFICFCEQCSSLNQNSGLVEKSICDPCGNCEKCGYINPPIKPCCEKCACRCRGAFTAHYGCDNFICECHQTPKIKTMMAWGKEQKNKVIKDLFWLKEKCGNYTYINELIEKYAKN